MGIKKLNYLQSFKLSDFIAASQKIDRSKHQCNLRWKKHILPVLKTDALKLPHGTEWMKDFLSYIATAKIMNTKQIPYDKIIKEVCPGQTTSTLTTFANNLKLKWDGQKLSQSKEPLYKICVCRLTSPHGQSFLGNENKVKERLSYVEEILKIKKLLINKKFDIKNDIKRKKIS